MAQEEGYLNNPQAQYPDFPEQVAVGSYSYTAPGKNSRKLRIAQVFDMFRFLRWSTNFTHIQS
jgi:hypothetical protein